MSAVRPRKKTRFIAGASCPSCNSIDTLQLERGDNVSVISCVACGHQETQAPAPAKQAERPAEQLIGVYTPE